MKQNLKVITDFVYEGNTSNVKGFTYYIGVTKNDGNHMVEGDFKTRKEADERLKELQTTI